MENLALKVRLSALWSLGMLAGVMGTMLEMYEPGMIDEIRTGVVGGVEITQEMLLLMAILTAISLLMAFLCLILKDSTNRWANLIAGIFFTGLGFFEIIEYLALGISAYVILLRIVGIVFPALIVWYAWKWPKEES